MEEELDGYDGKDNQLQVYDELWGCGVGGQAMIRKKESMSWHMDRRMLRYTEEAHWELEHQGFATH